MKARIVSGTPESSSGRPQPEVADPSPRVLPDDDGLSPKPHEHGRLRREEAARLLTLAALAVETGAC